MATRSRSLLDSFNAVLLQRFYRVASGPVLREIDGLRFICISAVFFFHINLYLLAKSYTQPEHAAGLLSRIASHGAWGVQLFFLISGFVVSLPFARYAFASGTRPQLRWYYLRRLTRLEPPYILNLLLLFPLVLIAKNVPASSLAPNLLASMTYTHGLIFRHASAISHVAWSLEVEVQFYLLAPLLTLVFFIRNAVARRALFVVAIALTTAMQPLLRRWLDWNLVSLTLLHYIAFFLAGMLLADLFIASWKSAPQRTYAWDLVFVSAFGAAIAICLADLYPEVLFPALFFVIGCAIFRGRVTSAVLSTPIIAVIGAMCYTIYLYHGAIISGVGRFSVRWFGNSLPFPAAFAIQSLILGLVSLLICGILFMLVERPCMNPSWPRRLMNGIRNAFVRPRVESATTLRPSDGG